MRVTPAGEMENEVDPVGDLAVDAGVCVTRLGGTLVTPVGIASTGAP
jgi:hypothetical protein